MNNVVTYVFMIGVAIFVWSSERIAIGNKDSSILSMQQELVGLASRAAITQNDLEVLRSRAIALKQQIGDHGNSSGSTVKYLDVAHFPEDGQWPNDTSWFFLKKELISKVGHELFKPNGEITETMSFLLGMSPDETLSVDAAYKRMRDAFLSAEARSIIRTNPPSFWVSTWPNTRLECFLIPPVPQAQELQKSLSDQLFAILGPDRAELFLNKFKTDQRAIYVSPTGSDPRLLGVFYEQDKQNEIRALLIGTLDGAGPAAYPNDESQVIYNRYLPLIDRLRKDSDPTHQ
jgi:hypothetical protein